MAASRKNRTASPRAKAGIGAARAVSQARSLPEDDPVIPDDAMPVSTEAEAEAEVVVTEAVVTEAVVTEAVVIEAVPESIIEIVTDFEPALLVDDLNAIGEVSFLEDILEAEIEVSSPVESHPGSETAVILESIPDTVALPSESSSPMSQETPAQAAVVSTPRSKSKVSNPKSSVQRPKGDKTMTQETEKSAPLATKKESAIAKTGSALPVRPVTPSELTVVGMISSAGERPIGAATMAVFGTYLNGRPIEASSLKLFEILPGDRPIFSTEIAYVPGTPLGGRPIMISPAGLLGAEEVMGNRPIFSNDIVDPDSASLMGYLD